MSNKRKLTLPPQRKTPDIKPREVVLLPELQAVLDDAAATVSLELAKLRRRSQTGSAPMDLETARVLQGYVKSAVDLSREYRERDKLEDHDGLSDEELLDTFLDNLPKEEVYKLLQKKLNEKSKPDSDPQDGE